VFEPPCKTSEPGICGSSNRSETAALEQKKKSSSSPTSSFRLKVRHCRCLLPRIYVMTKRYLNGTYYCYDDGIDPRGRVNIIFTRYTCYNIIIIIIIAYQPYNCSRLWSDICVPTLRLHGPVGRMSKRAAYNPETMCSRSSSLRQPLASRRHVTIGRARVWSNRDQSVGSRLHRDPYVKIIILPSLLLFTLVRVICLFVFVCSAVRGVRPSPAVVAENARVRWRNHSTRSELLFDDKHSILLYLFRS